MINNQLIIITALIFLTRQVDCQQLSYDDFVQNFASCKWDSANFDKCVKDGLNSVRPFFKAGIPELNIGSFDPFFASEVTQTRGGNNLNYKLKLKNVYEKGWTQSTVTKFRCNWRKGFIQYTQYFPEKFLEGEYEIDGTVMASNMKNKGFWNMTLYDYVQTTTLTRPNNSKDIKVRIEVQQIGNMDLHISNLLRGRTVMENMLDRMINASWRPGFAVIRPLINDIVSTAFTEIFNKNFRDLDINNIIPNN